MTIPVLAALAGFCGGLAVVGCAGAVGWWLLVRLDSLASAIDAAQDDGHAPDFPHHAPEAR